MGFNSAFKELTKWQTVLSIVFVRTPLFKIVTLNLNFLIYNDTL